VSVLTQDVRYALRSLARAPGFTLVALLTLALGIGATSSIFSVVDGIVLRPLPYPNPGSIVRLSPTSADGESDAAFSPADYLDYTRQSRAFVHLAAYRQNAVDLTGRGEPVRLSAVEATGAFFDVFGLPPLAGRPFADRIDPPDGPRVAVISERLWREQFGGAVDIVGSSIRIDGNPTTVLGIMPKAFVHPSRADVWMLARREVPSVPIQVDGDLLAQRDVQYFNAVGRLRPDVTLAEARGELRVIGARIALDNPNTNEGEAATVYPLQDVLVGDVRTALLVLLGAVGFVLLIACANVASLLLARGTGRRRELAVRSALGASRARLMVQLLTESLVLAVVGGTLGLLVAYWGVDVLLALAPESIPRIGEVQLDGRVAAFAIVTSAAVGIVFGLVPALQGARAEVADALKDGGRTGTSRSRARNVLVVAEIALSLVLLIGAGLMLTSFLRLRAVDPGFTVESLMLVGVPLPQGRYDTPAQARFYEQLYERVTANPVTRRAALVFPTPFGGASAAGGYVVEGAPPRPRGERSVAQLNAVSPGYFHTMGIPLLQGRDVSFADKRDGPGRIVINRTMAEREWPERDPIGRRIIMGNPADDPNAWLTVVGIVADSKRDNLQGGPQPALYLSLSQFTVPFTGVVIRSDAGEVATATAVKTAVHSLDPELPVGELRTLERILEQATGQPRFRAMLVAAFATAALLLAAVGLYGLISFTVAQRRPEIAVRLALGASPAQVARLIVGHGLRLAVVGIAIGAGGALALAQLLQGLLFSISATDPRVYASLILLLFTIAAIACYVPARRAMRIDPMTALRAE
jgi:putative ABC transport system permease protein